MSEEDKEIADIIASLDKKEVPETPKKVEKPTSKEEPLLTDDEPDNWEIEDIPEEFQ